MGAPPVFCYPFTLVSVYDGDTITAALDVGFGWEKKKLKCRLYGIDTLFWILVLCMEGVGRGTNC